MSADIKATQFTELQWSEPHLTPLRFHDLRHSAVYVLRKGGCDAKDIQSWLGHSDVTTTLNVYGHVLGSDLGRLGQIMDSMVG